MDSTHDVDLTPHLTARTITDYEGFPCLQRKTKYEELPLVMSAKDIQVLGFSRSLAYGLLNRADVPVIVIGGRKFVQRDRFFEWLDKQAGAAVV